MLYLLQGLFINNWGVLRIFKSIMLRASVAFMIAFLFMLIFGKPFITWLKKKKYGDTAREEGPKSHFDKSGTPTMGGILIIGAILFATAVAGNFTNKFIIFLFIITILFTTIGFYDDYLKLTRHKNGLSGKKKILGQMIITALTFWFVYKYGLVNKMIDFSIELSEKVLPTYFKVLQIDSYSTVSDINRMITDIENISISDTDTKQMMTEAASYLRAVRDYANAKSSSSYSYDSNAYDKYLDASDKFEAAHKKWTNSVDKRTDEAQIKNEVNDLIEELSHKGKDS